VTNIIKTGDITPLTEEEQVFIKSIFNDDCFINVNEKVSPQILTRVFECLFNKNSNIISLTDTKITNLNSLLDSLQILSINTSPQPTPSVTSSVTSTPSFTPTSSLTPSYTTTPSSTIPASPSTTPTNTPSSTPTPSTFTCQVYMFYANNGNVGEVTYEICDPSSTPTAYTVLDRQIICVKQSTIPTSSDGYLINLSTTCNF
jgi:hypothetical protein